MEYCNVKVPIETAWLDTDEDIFAMLRVMVGNNCTPIGKPLDYNASIGYSSYGPWVEGDIDFTRNGLVYSLSYDFMQVGDKGRVFRYVVDRRMCFGE